MSGIYFKDILFLLLLWSTVVSTQALDCIAYEYMDQYYYEQWDFRLDSWEHKTISIVSSEYNLPPMSGDYRFLISFCDGVHIFIGDESSGALGWSFGNMVLFLGLDVNPPVPPSVPVVAPTSFRDDPFHEYSAFKEFSQIFTNGDTGAPCAIEPRSATVNIYCGLSKANCTQVPGNKGAECLNTGGDTQNGFCLCSIQYNATGGICTGLTLNLLSNVCPNSVTVPIVTPPVIPAYTNREGIGIAFGVIAVLLIVCIIGGYVYNFAVHHKRGCMALPFYDTCTGKKVDPTYEVASPSYGSIAV